jgi:hypothetical protein
MITKAHLLRRSEVFGLLSCRRVVSSGHTGRMLRIFRILGPVDFNSIIQHLFRLASLICGFCSILNDVSRQSRGEKDSPLLLASSSSPLSTSLAGRCTYLTTEPLASCQPVSPHCNHSSESAWSLPSQLLEQSVSLRPKCWQRKVGFDVPNKDVLDTAKVRVLKLVEYGDVIELYVQVLVNGFEGAPDRNVVLELNCHG